MSRTLEENTIFICLAKEIMNLCSSENITVTLDFCAFLLDIKLLQLSKNISLVVRSKDLKEVIVKRCVHEIKEDFLSIKIIKLQFLWWKKYQPRDEIKRIHHERVFKNILPIMTEIAEDTPSKAFDKDHFYKKIVIFIIMFAGLGSPTEQSIIKETQAALHSIFKTTEVENFLSLPKATKEQQLMEFARLITGIMLFNKDCKKGGDGMDDLPLILTQGVQATKERFLGFKDQLDQKIDQVAKALLQIYEVSQGSEEKVDCIEHEDRISTSDAFQKENLEEFKTLLIYFRQIECCLNDLMKDLEKSILNVEELVHRLQSALLQLHNVVRYRVAVATIQVFPLFEQLSNIWVEMQEEVDILSEINDNFVELSLTRKHLSLPSVQQPSTTEAPASEANEIHDSSEFYPGVKVCSISSVSDQEYVQYKGFCAWTLSHTGGLLITGNITIGVLKFSNRLYTFSSVEAANKWALDPNFYIKSVLRLARIRPELIKFLMLEDDLIENLTAEGGEKPAMSNAEIQTDVHVTEGLIDKDYTFSEWEIKKRVMKLATLTRCATKSQQTETQSCFRTETGTQVTLCKNVTTQTTKDAFCSHPPFTRFAWGLKRELPEFFEPDSRVNTLKKAISFDVKMLLLSLWQKSISE